ncbi:D-Ala-D-Ala carboxypeptidase. Serine peptidase. MEROPS family S13 [Candidatus Sulfopaludibacter sp. SbA4]|nr:D-Ala-D-Ala carboxypeptidase. Serine peptidase. MEROPS family S13 [Candidatus Sulfopaludibacter sp. SbA4]
MRRLALAFLTAALASAASLPESIERLLATTPGARTAFWGIQIVDLAHGKTLYELNPDHFFIPASNTKLFTTAMALTRLGPDFTFQTRVLADSPPDRDGRIHGALRLVGGGDPNLSARAIPYRMGAVTGNPLVAIEDLADQVAARGVKRVEGGVVGDDTWYLWQPYASGWAIEDPQSDDGPPVSALTIHDNTLSLNVGPGAREGDLAAVLFNPPVEYYRLDNRIRTVAVGGERRIHFSRIPGSLEARLWGTIPLRDRGQDMLVGIEDPALYAAQVFRRALEERGIVVEGDSTARHQYPNEVADLRQAPSGTVASGAELAQRTSALLIEDLRITDKVSQNLHAEMALRAVGRARRNLGSFEAGLEELKVFLGEAGIAQEDYNLHDGSGLARLNLVTPATVVKLLRYMYGSPSRENSARENWISLLPVGGQDGTLSTRFGEGAAAGRVHAKTGSLSHVSALSGYVQRLNGGWVAFSILVNNYNTRNGDVRGVMDRICNLILE